MNKQELVTTLHVSRQQFVLSAEITDGQFGGFLRDKRTGKFNQRLFDCGFAVKNGKRYSFSTSIIPYFKKHRTNSDIKAQLFAALYNTINDADKIKQSSSDMCYSQFDFHFDQPQDIKRMKEKYKEKHPLGLRPKWLRDMDSVKEIREAILRYWDAGKKVPQGWFDEINSYMK